MLRVWYDDQLVGSFVESDDGNISFSYAPNPPLQLSLSLPVDAVIAHEAPVRFLDNLLPDGAGARRAMMMSVGAASTQLFDLLDRVDAAGGCVYSLAESCPMSTPSPLVPLTDDDLIARIEAYAQLENPIVEPSAGMRFSLAGSQGKFSFATIDGARYLSGPTTPSTHIIKPEPHRLAGVARIESATLDLACACGLSVCDHGVVEGAVMPAFITARFDREHAGTTACRRLHVEDFAQAAGLAGGSKYDMTAEEALALLKSADSSGELAMDWIEQFAFNAYCGNADGHAKNYSLIYGANGIALAPLYDAVMTSCWESFDRGMGMSVNDEVFYPEYLDETAWIGLARRSGLPVERVVDCARRIATDVMEKAPDTLMGLERGERDRALKGIARATSGILK